MKRRLVSWLLVLVLVAGLLPAGALAVGGSEGAASASVDFTAQAAGAFLCAPQFDAEVSGALAEDYGYSDSVTGGVSALDVLVKAHEVIFGAGFTPDTAGDYLKFGSSGFITKVFGEETSNFSFTVNGAMPHDNVLKNDAYVPGGQSYTGYTINQTEVKTGDQLEFYLYQDSYAMDNYPLPEQSGSKVTSLTGEAGTSLELTLKGYCIGYYGCVPMEALEKNDQIQTLESVQLAWVDAATGALTDITGAITDEDGQVQFSLPSQAGTYYLTAYMPAEEIQENYATPVIMTLIPVTITAAAQTQAPPTAITVKYVGDQLVPGTSTLIGKTGDTFPFKAYDQTGAETPVTWSAQYSGTIDADGVYTAASLSSGGTSYLYVTAKSTLDASITQETRFELTGYGFSTYQKNQTVALSSDGQSAKTATVTGGYKGHTVWSYDETAVEGIAVLASDSGTGNSIQFHVLRPGTFTVGFHLDFDENMTDTATVTITGVAVEDTAGAQGKTYLTRTSGAVEPTVQLTAYAAQGRTIAGWSSGNPAVATVDESGLVTAKGVGTALITATDSEGTTGGIKVVVQDGETPYFEAIEFSASALESGAWESGKTFSATQLEYDLPIRTYSTSALTLQGSTLYNTERYTAVASYTDSNGTVRNVPVNSGAVTTLDNIPFGGSMVTITLSDKADGENKTVYTFHVTRPRDTTKTIKFNGIVLVPEGRTLLSTKYNGFAEGTMLKADGAGAPTSGTGVSSTQYYYRTYALDGLEAFSLTISGQTAYTRLRWSADDGKTWTELPQGGGTTEPIAFPDQGEKVVKVQVQVLGDQDYFENAGQGTDGFSGAAPEQLSTYTIWVEQVQSTSSSAQILTAKTDTGDWYPAFSPDTYSYNIVVPNGTTSGTLTYTVSDRATVKVGSTVQTAAEDGTYTLALTTSSQTITVTAADGYISNSYTFKLLRKSASDVPDKVVDYLCINSQYTNSAMYGLQPEVTLAGSLKSLGNFGGYITYYYETPLVNDLHNLYGVDFYIYGNALQDTSTSTKMGFFEPGQVWVSEDGETWYALAGSAHYDDGVDWNYTVTYIETAGGKTAWTDSQGNSHDGSSYAGQYPVASKYPLHTFDSGNSITLSGVLLPGSNGQTATVGQMTDAYPANWGYVDVFPNGAFGADVNPYLDNTDHTNKTNGFDLAWAVDAQGNPVDVSGMEFHYVKVQTASNIWAPAINEKSTEVTQVMRTTAQGEEVGVTTAPAGVTITDGISARTVEFTDGQQVYEVDLGDMKYVSVSVNGAAEDDNIYVNNQRIASSGAAEGIRVTAENSPRLVRILVQNGEKAPVLYLLKLTSSASASSDLIEGVKIDVSGSARMAETTDGATYTASVGYRIDKVEILPIAASDVDVTINDSPAQESYALAEGENTFVIAGEKDGNTHTVTLKITREAAPVSTGKITVYFTLMGDSAHGEGEVHTLKDGGLETWISRTAYELDAPATVLDVFRAAVEGKYSFTNPGGNYITEVNGLGEFTNGPLSGWMYTLNGEHPNLGVAEQTVKRGDSIVFHYTDDYTKEQGSEEWGGGPVTPPATTPPAQEVLPFADVAKDQWFYDAVEYVYSKELMDGVSETAFAPDATLSRGMVATVLYRLAGEPASAGESAAFPDVTSDAWFAKAVSWASAEQIVTGYDDGKFYPDGNITREELAVMLWRYAKAAGKDTGTTGDLSAFSDTAAVSSWAVKALTWCVEQGILTGRDSGILDPGGTATRAEAAAILMRYSQK